MSTQFSKTVVQFLASGGFVASLLALAPLSQTSMRESPQKASTHYAGSEKLCIDVDAFNRDGIVVIENALNPEELRLARIEFDAMLASDSLFEKTEQDNDDVRTDKVYWISEPICSQRISLGPGMSNALRVVRSAPLAFLIASDRLDDSDSYGVPLSNQLASYSHGGKYVPHRDTPGRADAGFHHPLQRILQPGLNDRKLTIILYLNESDWDCGVDEVSGESRYEGCLRCYLGADDSDETGSTSPNVINISPKGGRMVIFDSQRVLHEVRPFSPDQRTKNLVDERDGSGVKPKGRPVVGERQRAAITCWVGGSHSAYPFLQPFSIPRDEVEYYFWK